MAFASAHRRTSPSSRTSGSSETVNQAGGEILLDERVRRGREPPPEAVRHPPGRRPMTTSPSSAASTSATAATTTPATAATRRRSSSTSGTAIGRPWHDIQLEVRGPAVGDARRHVPRTLGGSRPLDHRNPVRQGAPPVTAPTPPPRPVAPACGANRALCGPHAVQVLRTYPAKRPPYPVRARRRAQHRRVRTARRCGAPDGSSTWRISTSGRTSAAWALADALRGPPELHVIVVVPRFPDRERARRRDRRARIGRQHVTRDRSSRRAAIGSSSTTSRTRTERRSTCTPRSASSTTSGSGRLRQHEPALVDPRLGAVVRRARRHARRARAARSGRPR